MSLHFGFTNQLKRLNLPSNFAGLGYLLKKQQILKNKSERFVE
jgi:hypothetical protein